MKKSLLLLFMCLNVWGTYAQDDDVYFVPSSKQHTAKAVQPAEDRSTYTPIPSDETNWAEGRGDGGRDVDAYNRRGRNYRGECNDTLSDKSCYDQGYEDGFEDGTCTSRIVRFWSPRPGVYVSSPYYMDYYDLCYDPWYYGYGTVWSWGWSGWWGWGSWYGWRPYYSSWWGWGPSWAWYDPWWGYPGWHGDHPHHWYPSNAVSGPRGGYLAYGGRRGTSGSTAFGGRGGSMRPSSSLGMSGRYTGSTANRPSRSYGSGRVSGTPSSGGNSLRNNGTSSRPSRSFGNSNRESGKNSDSYRSSGSNRSSQRSSTYSQPSRSSFGSGGGFSGGGSRSGGGGGRSFGGRR